SSPGAESPPKLTVVLRRVRPRRSVSSVRERPSTSTSSVPPIRAVLRSCAIRWVGPTSRSMRSIFVSWGCGSRLSAAPVPWRGEAAPTPRVDVLAQQRHLLYTVGSELRDLGQDVAGTAALLVAADGGDDAVGAHRVAPHRRLHPRLERALTMGGQGRGKRALA